MREKLSRNASKSSLFKKINEKVEYKLSLLSNCWSIDSVYNCSWVFDSKQRTCFISVLHSIQSHCNVKFIEAFAWFLSGDSKWKCCKRNIIRREEGTYCFPSLEVSSQQPKSIKHHILFDCCVRGSEWRQLYLCWATVCICSMFIQASPIQYFLWDFFFIILFYACTTTLRTKRVFKQFPFHFGLMVLWRRFFYNAKNTIKLGVKIQTMQTYMEGN